MAETSNLLGRLADLQRDPEPAARAVGAALTAAALDALRPDERDFVASIEELRAEMEGSDEQIDTALSNRRGVVKMAELGDTCRRRSKKQSWGVFLLTLARTLAPARCLELGACLGISGSYLAAGQQLAGGGRLLTLEGAPALAERAQRNLAALGLDQAEVIPGLFAATLEDAIRDLAPIDLAFIDGHHQEEPTLAYLEAIIPHLSEFAVVVFDDIRWSDGMERAWSRIIADPRVHVAVDLSSVGVCLLGEPSTGARVYEFPTLSSMRSTLVRERPTAAPGTRYEVPSDAIARLNWGCGHAGEPGWVNSDIKGAPTIDITCDIRDGLPVDDDAFDYAVSIHALTMVPLPEIDQALRELRRVLKPGATLRLGLADLDRNIAAYQSGDRDFFLVPDRDAETTAGKFITQLVWYGYSVTPLNAGIRRGALAASWLQCGAPLPLPRDGEHARRDLRARRSRSRELLHRGRQVSRATVMVSGALANKAGNGGAAWTRLSWALGFRRLGFDVVFVEQLAPHLGPAEVSFFSAVTEAFELDATLLGADGATTVGRDRADLGDLAAGAVALINISGHLRDADLVRAAPRRVYVDLDPGWTQLWHADGTAPLDPHDHWYTVGLEVGRGADVACDVAWRPILQPVLLDEWPVMTTSVVDRLTTVGGWRGYGTITRGNTALGPKAHEFRRFAALPSAVPEVTFELALAIDDDDRADRELLLQGGWRLSDPRAVCGDPSAFRDYVASSPGEFSVAQGMYVRTGSGWFSDRTTRYLASGRPAVVQDTGWTHHLPCGEGLFGYTTLEEAANAVRQVAADPERHAKAARDIADEYFASDVVLGRLCEEVGIAP